MTAGDRPTTRKTRVVAHNQQVVRADWESVLLWLGALRIALALRPRLRTRGRGDVDAVVLSRTMRRGCFRARSSSRRLRRGLWWRIRSRRTSRFSPA